MAPPRRVTRTISRIVAGTESTCSITEKQWTRSKAPSANGSASAAPPPKPSPAPRPGPPLPPAPPPPPPPPPHPRHGHAGGAGRRIEAARTAADVQDAPPERTGADQRFETGQTRVLPDLLLASPADKRAPVGDAQGVAVIRGVVPIGRLAKLWRMTHALVTAERATESPATSSW